MQYKGWICDGMLYGMGMFLLCGNTGLQATEKDGEAQVAETNLAKVNETPIVPKIDCLIEAIRHGDNEKALEANGTPISTMVYCIINAMRNGDSKKALQLLEGIEDKDINHTDQLNKITLLGAAVLFNLRDVVRALLKRGADLNIECFDPNVKYRLPHDAFHRFTPFDIAAIDQNNEMIVFLIRCGADVSALGLESTPRQMISYNCFQLKNVQLKNEVVEENETSIVDKIDCIIEAMRDGDSEKALQLIESIEDKDINLRGRRREITPLGAAVLFNLRDVAQDLLKRGVNPNVKCFDLDVECCESDDPLYGNCTPFGIAIINKNKKMIKFLIKHGADVNALILGNTPLQMILSDYFYLEGDYFSPTNHWDWLRIGHDNLQLDDDDYGGIYRDCLQRLPPGQNYLRLDNEGLKILNDCCSENILEEMRLFIENGADVNARDDQGNTILHYLAGNFSYGMPFALEFADLLFRAGADPRIANNQGESSLKKLELPSYVAERFPERVENYDKLMDMFRQRTDELDVQESKCSGVSFFQRKNMTYNAKRTGNFRRRLKHGRRPTLAPHRGSTTGKRLRVQRSCSEWEHVVFSHL